MGKLRTTMKNINFAYFVLLTFWSSFITSGWWILATCPSKPIVFASIFLVNLALSGLYIAELAMKLVKALDDV